MLKLDLRAWIGVYIVSYGGMGRRLLVAAQKDVSIKIILIT